MERRGFAESGKDAAHRDGVGRETGGASLGGRQANNRRQRKSPESLARNAWTLSFGFDRVGDDARELPVPIWINGADAVGERRMGGEEVEERTEYYSTSDLLICSLENFTVAYKRGL